VAPKTSWGRVLTIVYALIGIPLTFLYLSNIGNFLADCFRLFYKRVCCDVLCCEKCERKRKRQRLKQRRRREIMAADAHQRNFRFGEWTEEMATVDLEPGRKPAFVEIPEVARLSVIAPLRRHQSSSSWTTVSTSSATAAEGEGSLGEETANAVSGARETDIVKDETSDDDRTTTDDGRTVRETDIIGDDEDYEDPTTSGEQKQRLLVGTADVAPCRDTRSARQPPQRCCLPRPHSDTKLDLAAQTSSTGSAANDKNRHVVTSDTGAPEANDRDVIRRSASVKARATGCLACSCLCFPNYAYNVFYLTVRPSVRSFVTKLVNMIF